MYAPDGDKAERESRDLIRRIDASDDKVRDLARTPLLSTIFALVHRAKRQLPQQRAELYEEAVTTLLEESYRKDEADPGARQGDAQRAGRRRVTRIGADRGAAIDANILDFSHVHSHAAFDDASRGVRIASKRHI